jgi:hypothetical protein
MSVTPIAAGTRTPMQGLESFETDREGFSSIQSLGWNWVTGRLAAPFFPRMFTDDGGFIECELREFCFSIGS